MKGFAAFFPSVLIACCLSHWMIVAAGAAKTIEEELSFAATIYASIADANCENDEDKFSKFYDDIRRSIQEEGKFEDYFPDKGELRRRKNGRIYLRNGFRTTLAFFFPSFCIYSLLRTSQSLI